MSKVIVITGPTGSGKSTVGIKLAKVRPNTVNIDADYIKHMNPGAFEKKLVNGSEKFEYNDWALVGKNIAILAQNFIRTGYDVVINGYIDNEAWHEIFNNIKVNCRFLLLPKIEQTKLRDKNRKPEISMGGDAVEEHYEHFTSASIYKNFEIIDSTNLSVDETVDTIRKLI